MKKITTLLACTGLGLSVISATFLPALHAKEDAEPKVTATIRPKGHVKKHDLPALAKISFSDALKAALVAAPGSVIKAELEIEDGNLMYSFDVVSADKTILEVEIDAGDGHVLSVGKD